MTAARPSPDYAQEAYVIEQSRTTLRFENDGTGRRDCICVKVQSEAGAGVGAAAFPITLRMNGWTSSLARPRRRHSDRAG
jgi:hypothetical protein